MANILCKKIESSIIIKSSRNDFAVVADAVPFWNVDNNLQVVKCGEHQVQHGCGEHGG